MIPVIAYLLGLGVFGLVYWLLDNILDLFIAESLHITGAVFTLSMAIWTAGLILYLIVGGIWVMRKYNEQEYQGGFF